MKRGRRLVGMEECRGLWVEEEQRKERRKNSQKKLCMKTYAVVKPIALYIIEKETKA